MSLRVGIGVDAHAFEDGVPLVLAGVRFESPRGLAGHSDGDVITHALIDAVLRWSRDHGAQSVELWVTVTNEAARRLYLRSGFRETGVRQALPSDPSIEEVEMRLVHRGA